MDFLVVPITPGPPRGQWPAAWTASPTCRRAAPSHSGGKPGMARVWLLYSPRSSLTGGSPLPATAASTRAVDVYRIQHHAVGRCWARRPYGGGRLRRPDTEVPTHSPGGGSEAADRKRGTPSGGRVKVAV